MGICATRERAAPRLDSTWGYATEVLDLPRQVSNATVDTVGSLAHPRAQGFLLACADALLQILKTYATSLSHNRYVDANMTDKS